MDKKFKIIWIALIIAIIGCAVGTWLVMNHKVKQWNRQSGQNATFVPYQAGSPAGSS